MKLVIFDDMTVGFFCSIFLKLSNVKIIFSEGNISPWVMPYVHKLDSSVVARLVWVLKVLLGRLTCKLSSVVRVQSKLIMDGMVQYGIDQSKICIIGPGVDVLTFKPLPAKKSDNCQNSIGFIGRLTEIKGVSLLLNVITLTSQVNPRIRFFIMGDGPWKEKFSKLPNVDHIGYISHDDLPVWLAKVNIILFFQKDLGLALVEAMASGKAVIACESGEAKSIVRNMENGILCAPLASCYVQAIDLLNNNSALEQYISRNARATAINYFAWEKIGSDWVRAIENAFSIK